MDTHASAIPYNHFGLPRNLEGLTKLATALFNRWGLTSDEIKRVLNRDQADAPTVFSETDRSRLTGLLEIHAYLRLLYPKNPEMRYQWIKLSNHFFNNRTPFDVIVEDQPAGLEIVTHHLRTACYR